MNMYMYKNSKNEYALYRDWNGVHGEFHRLGFNSRCSEPDEVHEFPNSLPLHVLKKEGDAPRDWIWYSRHSLCESLDGPFSSLSTGTKKVLRKYFEAN